ncbi:MAG: hypothetical protein Ta2F_00500 [Termitinemataceae bacterium]|nr:MAG: hypothetical protein Ta2F_00500 [Termitinemataceae bacterium]
MRKNYKGGNTVTVMVLLTVLFLVMACTKAKAQSNDSLEPIAEVADASNTNKATNIVDFPKNWISEMVKYFGKTSIELPDSYIKKYDGSYAKSISNGVTEGFILKKGTIEQSVWMYEPDKRSLLSTEFNLVLKVLEKQLGDPLIVDGYTRCWKLNSDFLIILMLDENIESVTVSVLSFGKGIEYSEQDFDKRVKEMNEGHK